MSLDEITEKYSYITKDIKLNLSELNKRYNEVKELQKQYNNSLKALDELNINIIVDKKEKEIKSLSQINNMIDKTLRYIEFWLSVHYYECKLSSSSLSKICTIFSKDVLCLAL